MAGENVGAIYYTVEADTEKLLSAAKPADKALDGLESSFKRTDKAANDANFRMKKTAAAIKGMGRQASQTTDLLRGMLPVLSGALLIKTARDILATADAWTEMQNRLRQVTSSQKELNQATNDVFRIAQTTSQALEPVAQVYQRLAQNAAQLGIDQKKVAEITETVSKAMAASGASADAADAALRQLGQGLASGTLRGDELNSVMEQTPALAQAIATGLGVTIGELRTLGAEGKITAKSLIEALTNAGESVNQQFGTRVKTASQAWVELRNSVTRFIGEANNSVALTNSLADGIERVSRAIDDADIDKMAQEIEGLGATIRLVMDGADALFGGMSSSAQSATNSVTRSFTEMALATAKEADGIAKVFQGTAGAVGAVWEALANNIPAFFSNAWGQIKQGAAEFVNDLADLINKPIQAMGGAGIGKISVDQAPIRAIVSLGDAAAEGWENAAKGVGAYDRTLRRVTDNAINSSIAEWQSEYTEEVEKTTAATEKAAASSGKLSAAQKQEAKAREANNKVIADMVEALMLAGMEGESLAMAKAASRLNVFATPAEVEQVKALAAALYQVQQAKADQQLINQADPIKAEQEKYETQLAAYQDMLDRKAISDEQYYQYAGDLAQQHEETMLALQEERFRNESMYNDLLMTGLDSLGEAAAATLTGIITGTANAEDAARAFAATIGKEVIAEFVRMGVAHVKAVILGRAAETAAGAAYAAATASQVQATTALAAQAAFASTAAIPIVGPALAPAAAAAAAAAAGALGAPAIGFSAAAGARQYGGPVDPSGLYRINETGAPEILNLANGRQYMLPNSRGEVISNRDATRQAAGSSAGSGSQPTIINLGGIHISTSWPPSDKEVRVLVTKINDALDDGMKLR
ncbi:tape measure protein [Castellaniella sp.]|uniref:tape measure protein n=1 Tax=Castellaniella sp. TaxID=1955812 RepID=UPI002AFFA294|nr:tape measure protein [Castellaniella sp.]